MITSEQWDERYPIMKTDEYDTLTAFERAMLEEMAKIRRAIEALKED